LISVMAFSICGWIGVMSCRRSRDGEEALALVDPDELVIPDQLGPAVAARGGVSVGVRKHKFDRTIWS